MKKSIVIILALLLSAFAFYYIGKKFFPFNKFFGARVIPANILLSGAYSNSETANSLLCNFEIDPREKLPPGFYKGIAHSGHFSAKAFGKNSYSLAIEQTAGQIGIDKLKSIAMSAWIFIFPTDKEPDGIYVLSVTNAFGISKCWKGIYVKGSSAPHGKWFRISGLFDLSEIILQPGNKIHIYFWNRSHTDILVDDYYIIFGGQKERRGESTLTDLTKNPVFNPRFNFPPFPTFYAEKEEISNRNSADLAPDNSVKGGDIFPEDKIIAGNFLQTRYGTDAILVIPSSGKPELFSFCPASTSFKKINVILPSEVLSFFKSAKALKGRFTENTYDEVLLEGDHEFIVGSFTPLTILCSTMKAASSEFKVIWKSDPAFMATGLKSKGARILAGDLFGDRYTELLTINDDGSWKILKFLSGKVQKGGWTVMASGRRKNSPFVNPGYGQIKITLGRFLPHCPQDLILTVTGNQTGKKLTSSLLKFDFAQSAFVPPDQNTFDGKLKIIGLDTLKPSDIFLFGDFRGNKEPQVLRYNRDWRFDLKELNFNDTTFSILGNVDFHGYDKDHNPKYYGVLKLVAGRIIDPARTSLLVIGRNCKNDDFATDHCKEYQNLPELPDFISVYSISNRVLPVLKM